ncbi:hypothetical protein [Streptomyces sp. NPDC047042]|uniref:hypothetical protein n=1 Tax=Streptomyces sp. NPDC047042 TaxID=3154807 RepID=UPI0033EA9666
MRSGRSPPSGGTAWSARQFSALARGLPFPRSGEWTWRDEQRPVFARYNGG